MSWHASLRMRLGDLKLDVELQGTPGPLALIGPNGSGKSTILRTIAGAYRPDAGRVSVAGTTLVDTEQQIDTSPESRAIGYVPQGFGLFPHLNVLDNVAFGLRGRGTDPGRSERRSRAEVMLAELDSADLADRRVDRLSGGEQQRVALARALITEPRLLLLDEPLSALDSAARRSVRAFLRERLIQRAVPTLVVTHDARDVAALQAAVVVLDQGSVVQTGEATEVASQPVNDFVSEFFGTMS